jgi:hypothetical protein
MRYIFINTQPYNLFVKKSKMFCLLFQKIFALKVLVQRCISVNRDGSFYLFSFIKALYIKLVKFLKMVVIFQDIHKKIKNNATFFLNRSKILINQKYILNFCFIKYLLFVIYMLYKIIKHHQFLPIYMFYIPFCRKFYT